MKKCNINRNFLSILVLVSWGHGYCQYKDMLRKPYKEKVEKIHELYHRVVKIGDSTKAFAVAGRLRELAVKNDDEALALEAEFLKAYYYCKHYHNNEKEVLRRLDAVAQKANKKGFVPIEARAVNELAEYYWNNKRNYEKAFEYLLRLGRILQNTTSQEFPNMANYLNRIGYAHYYFSDYKTAIGYYKRAASLPKTSFNALDIFNAKNTLGMCYQKLDNLQLSGSYYLSIIHDTTRFSSEIWKGIASVNLGYNRFLGGEYEKAIPLLKSGIKTAKKFHEDGLVADASTTLAKIYLKQDQLKKAEMNIARARKNIAVSKQYDRNRKLFPVRAKWYAKMGMPEKSAAYVDSSLVAIKTYRQKFNALKLMRANQKITAQRQELKIGNIKAESQAKIVQRNTLIAIVLSLLMAGAIAYWFRNKYMLRQKEIRELQLQNVNEALGHARTKLGNLTQKTLKNKKLIERLQQENQGQANLEMIQELKMGTILTEEDWDQYQLLFEQAYPGFLHKLKTAHHDFTQAELRCLCLEKLGLTNNEMATVLGVSANTAMVTKSRIRKKLKIKTKKGLHHWVQGF